MKPRLATFFTGGTISMRIDAKTGGAIPALSGAEVLAQVPGLDSIADFEVIDFGRLPGPPRDGWPCPADRARRFSTLHRLLPTFARATAPSAPRAAAPTRRRA
jgi:hypothetical protein